MPRLSPMVLGLCPWNPAAWGKEEGTERTELSPQEEAQQSGVSSGDEKVDETFNALLPGLFAELLPLLIQCIQLRLGRLRSAVSAVSFS